MPDPFPSSCRETKNSGTYESPDVILNGRAENIRSEGKFKRCCSAVATWSGMCNNAKTELLIIRTMNNPYQTGRILPRAIDEFQMGPAILSNFSIIELQSPGGGRSILDKDEDGRTGTDTRRRAVSRTVQCPSRSAHRFSAPRMWKHISM